MAELSKPVKAFFRAYIILCTVITFSCVPPVLIEQYWATASWAPIAKTVCVWIQDNGSHALAGGMFCVSIAMLGVLVTDAYKALSHILSASSTGPIALEDGVTVPAEAPPTTEAETPLPTQPSLRLITKLLLLFGSTFICTLFLSDVISVQRSLWQNIGAALMYILRGLQILQLLFGAFLVVMSFIWLRERRSAERDPAQAVAPEADEKAAGEEGKREKAEV
ncbi:hypothetical protein C8R45DRAFT_1011470 [Mycena sanguinolenta]|nr:hypothetical protein C8R45DRAFT_1011470 [Mycena sanguinolenta]